MSARVAADLRAAADVLERYGWAQGRYEYLDAHCASGAIAAVVSNAQRWAAARDFLSDHLDGEAVTCWNDDPDRTADEVIATLREAADRAGVER